MMLALLAACFAYHFDMECFLAQDQACLQLCQDAAEDSCAEPLLGSGPALALPIRLFYFESFLLQVECSTPPVISLTACSVSEILRPVGLRAPPSILA